MSLRDFLSVAGAMFGLLGLVGGAVAYLAAMRQRTTIEVLKEDNAARSSRMESLEQAEQECKARLDAAMVQVRVLTDTVTNAAAVADLLARVDLQHRDVKALDAKVDRHFAELLVRLEGKATA